MSRPIQKLFSLFKTRPEPLELQEPAAPMGEKYRAVFASEMPSVEQYETDYRRLANLLGRIEKTQVDSNHSGGSDESPQPSPGELERIRDLVERRANPAGSLGIADCLFLAACVSIIRPRRMVEIGTGSGFSSALLASVIQLQNRDLPIPCVETFDVQTAYFGDRKLSVGFEIANLIPQIAQLVQVHAPGESDSIRKLVNKDELEVAFIDGNHQHPVALLDLLRLAPYVRTGGWILLHDIQLGSFVEASRNTGSPLPFEAVFGAEWLFSDWPWLKIDGGNIGAVQLPERKKSLRAFAEAMMNRPMEVCQESYRRLSHDVNEAARACW